MDTKQLRTFALNAALTDSQIEKYETSNSVLISSSFFQEIMNNHHNDKKMLILGLYHKKKKIYVNIDAAHYDEDDIIYVPLWIYRYLQYEDGEFVNYMPVAPKSGNKIKIKPHSDFYAYLPDPVKSLRNGFEQYSILLKNTTIPLNINGRILLVDIIDTFTKNQPICIRGIELIVEIEEIETKDTKEIEETKETIEETKEETEEEDFSSMLPSDLNINYNFPGKGYNLK